ncbi:MAG: fibrobacter succinogenes major paralogous domain-containing protein, partial [Rikenellaceae bacterium]|nr:fibrobacter succinogenes major paralogous domain-containing protein [Rikenellaceae bacterium]
VYNCVAGLRASAGGGSARCGSYLAALPAQKSAGPKSAKAKTTHRPQASGGATFATKLPSQCSGVREESHGKFYQWGINVAWNTTGALGGATPSGSWNTSTYPSNWNTHPCPDGYRLPTDSEFQALINSSAASYHGGWNSSDYGYIKFTSGSNSVEFPAVGARGGTSGTLTNAGTWGPYWSSVASSSRDAYNLGFDSGNLYVLYYDRQFGFSVRCVR